MLSATLLYIILAAGAAAPGLTPSPVSFADTVQPAQPFPQAFTSKEGRFSVRIPAGYTPPALEVSDIDSDMGRIKLHMYTSFLSNESVCFVGYSDIKGVELEAELKMKMLDGAREGALKGMNATLDSERVITLDGHPGRTVHFTAAAENQQMRGRFDYYIVNTRLYQVGFIAATPSQVNDESTVAFFKSFAVLKSSTATPGNGKRKRR